MTNNSTGNDRDSSQHHTRRAVLGAVGTISASVAGCLGSGTSTDKPSGSGSGDGTATGTQSGDGTANSGCPKPPLAYEKQTVESSETEPSFSAEAPTVAEEVTTSPILSFEIAGAEKTALIQASSKPGESTVDETVASLGDGLTEVTDRYEFATTGARAFTIDPKQISKTTVVLPTNADAIVVLVSATIPEGSCRTAAEAAHRHIVETLVPV